jgi:adenylate cyclase
VALLAVAVGIVLYETNALNSLDNSTIDARFSIRGTQKPPKNLVVVEIDARTFQDLRLLWPFPRAVDGQVISDISADGPKLIALDVQTTEPSACPDDDVAGKCAQAQNDELALLGALNNANGKVVVSTTETLNGDSSEVEFLGSGQGRELLAQVGARAGNTNFPPDSGNVIRRMAYSIDGLQSFGVAAAEVVEGHKLRPSIFHGQTAFVDYYGPAGTIPAVSFGAVYKHQLPKGFFKNKIVVVGPSAPSLQDLHATPTSAVMPGAEVQASAIETVLRRLPLTWGPPWLDVLMIVALGGTIPLVIRRIGAGRATILAVALGAAFSVGVQVAFDSGMVMAYVYAMLALVISAVGALSVQVISEAFERSRTRDLFSRFVPEDVVDEVLAGADGGLRLGGVERYATIMFTDLRGFTTFAESLTPPQVIDVLNHYLSEMSDAILDHGGTLVAYMGDGIFAVFGAPITLEDSADRALATAREMLGVRLPRFNEWLRTEGLSDKGFRMGIGLNTGRVMSGNVGSERRVEYAAVGDTTNSAARIEALTKGTPHQLFFSQTTKEALQAPPDDVLFVDDFQLRGREATTKIYSLVDDGAGGGKASTAETVVKAAAQPTA